MNSCENSFVQEQIIEHEFNRYKALLNTDLDEYPIEIRNMLEYIHEHLFDKTLTVEEVKRACRLTNHNITTRFHYHVGTGIHRYITRKRLQAAAIMLEKKELTIFMVAASVGYNEEAFSRLFKKTYGITPTQHREKIREIRKILMKCKCIRLY